MRSLDSLTFDTTGSLKIRTKATREFGWRRTATSMR